MVNQRSRGAYTLTRGLRHFAISDPAFGDSRRTGLSLACVNIVGKVAGISPSGKGLPNKEAPLVFAPSAWAQGQEVTVRMEDNFFDPANITVEPGTTVTWVQGGNNPHATTSYDGLWDSGMIDRKSTRLNSSHANISYA